MAGRRVSAATVERITAALRHRGPEDEGLYRNDGVALGSRRLRILDLEGARQPLRNETGDIIAVFNGEIYNYRELRQELAAKGHRFATEGDGEVLVHLYEEHGGSLTRRLEGMFAFALWDRREQSLWLARDRFGVKPLYYSPRPEGIVFSSELGALLEDPDFSTEPDLAALDLYLELNYIPSPHTVYAAARKLPPATMLRWRRGELRLFRYWVLEEERAPAPPKRAPQSEAAAAEELRAHLRQAVSRRMVSDVPLGLFLSGGLDSATVLSFMAEQSPKPVKTFSIGFRERQFSELKMARRLARRFGCEHHELVLTPDAVSELPRLTEAFHEPFGDSSALPTYCLARMARRDVTACLGGDGGDEIFAGYETYRALQISLWCDRLPRRWLAGPPASWLDRLPLGHGKVPLQYRWRKFRTELAVPPRERTVRWRGIFSAAQRARLWRQPPPSVGAGALIAKIGEEWSDAAPLNRALYLDLRLYLADDILTKFDRMTMAHSLEGREPLLDTDLVRFMFGLPARFKMRRLQGKYLLRRAMRGRLPGAVLRGKKQGFSIPLGPWLRGPLRTLAEEHLLAPGGELAYWFEPSAIAALLREHMAAQADHGRQIWNLLCIALWLDRVASRRNASGAYAVRA